VTPTSSSTTKTASQRDILFAVPDITDAEVAEVVRVLTSGWITTGQECVALEEELAAYTGAKHMIAVSSCTAGLQILMAALGLPEGARIAVPDWTFACTAITPTHLGLRPVLIDIDPSTLCVSEEAMAAAIDEGIDAAVVVQFAGQPVPKSIYDMLADANIPVIEDAAHAMGTVDHRGMVAGQGTVGAAYSFYATKNLTSAEGGAIATERDDIAAFARAYRQHGMSSEAWKRYQKGGKSTYDLVHLGIKANLPDILAVLARVQLKRFEPMQNERRRIVALYRELLADMPSVRIIPGQANPGSAEHLFVVALPEGIDRTAAQAVMAEAGVGTSVHFRPLHRFDLLAKNSDIGPAGVGNAEALADRTLSLPLHPKLSDSDVRNVVAALGDALATQSNA